jgi:hypothetical protein
MKFSPLLLIIAVISFWSINSEAQTGIGLGSNGVALKPFHNQTLFLIFRTGLGAGYSIESFDFAVTPEISGSIKLIEHESYYLYGGLGAKGFARANIRSNDDIYNFTLYFMMPFGIECKPIPNNSNFAVCIESQVNFSKSGTINPGLYGLIEIVYYFNTKNTK